MPAIKQLPDLVINQIAAGEVVERPASVVKELLENAVDAGAKRVDLVIEAGGATLVRVVDDGAGMPADELPLAVTNHATSKIASAEELFRVGTLGFRGEALASIASVSRLTIRSRQADADGAQLTVNGGSADEVTPAGCPIGTTLEVRDLFYNTPVRRKFLRTPQTEAGHCTEAFARVALANPQTHFTFTHNSRLLHDLPPCQPASGQPDSGQPANGQVEDKAWRDRIAALFGEDLAAALIAVESHDERPEGPVGLAGYVAHPNHSRSHTRLQYLLVNGRAIRDRSLQHALGEAYRGLLLTGRKPICFLRLNMPPALVDVNVHPQKQEVRFADSGPLYSQLLGTLRQRFLTSDLRSLTREPDSEQPPSDAGEASDQSAGELVNWAKQSLASQQRPSGQQRPSSQHGPSDQQRRLDERSPAAGPHQPSGTPSFRPFPSSGDSLSLHRFTPAVGGGHGGDRSGGTQSTSGAVVETATRAAVGDSAKPASGADGFAPRAIQLHNRYLVVPSDEGMEVIDQHALHERVLYEQLRERVLAGPLETQKLLVPEPVDLTPAEAAAVLEHAAVLKQIGLEVQPFGGDTVLVASFPALLRRLTPGPTLREIAAQLTEAAAEPTAKQTARDVVDELLHTMSCKAAVKYGDPLTDEEITALLAARPGTENHHHCPHGRPTSLVFTTTELDRRFGRNG